MTLRVLIHQNPPMVEFMEAFNESFMEEYPNITVDMSVVNANDLATVTQTRLSAEDIDVIDIFGFSNSVQPYMSGATLPNWQIGYVGAVLMIAELVSTKPKSMTRVSGYNSISL